jgi:WD40 repeat protein
MAVPVDANGCTATQEVVEIEPRPGRQCDADTPPLGEKALGSSDCRALAHAVGVVVVWRNLSGLKSDPDNSFIAHNDSVTAIALSSASPILATASQSGQIRLWLTNGTLLAELSGGKQFQELMHSHSSTMVSIC